MPDSAIFDVRNDVKQNPYRCIMLWTAVSNCPLILAQPLDNSIRQLYYLVTDTTAVLLWRYF